MEQPLPADRAYPEALQAALKCKLFVGQDTSLPSFWPDGTQSPGRFDVSQAASRQGSGMPEVAIRFAESAIADLEAHSERLLALPDD
jgi:hypothetical protein